MLFWRGRVLYMKLFMTTVEAQKAILIYNLLGNWLLVIDV